MHTCKWCCGGVPSGLWQQQQQDVHFPEFFFADVCASALLHPLLVVAGGCRGRSVRRQLPGLAV